jgi:hypothetical protein
LPCEPAALHDGVCNLGELRIAAHAGIRFRDDSLLTVLPTPIACTVVYTNRVGIYFANIPKFLVFLYAAVDID